MSEVVFTVYGQPQPAGSKTAGVGKNGKTFVRDSAKKGKPWRTEVTKEAALAMNGAPLLDGPLSLAVTFVVPRPKGHFGVRGLRPSAPDYPIVRPDVTKLLRSVEDSMTGVVWRDDSQVVRQSATKQYGEPACAKVWVTTLNGGSP